MANTTASWNKGDAQPSLSAMSVNDTKVITGTKATVANMRKLCKARQGKKFKSKATGLRQHTITRKA